MNTAPVFRATYHDLKNVKTRGVVQLIFEVPAEEADAAMAVLGGIPKAKDERWVAIALLDKNKLEQPPQPAKDRRRFDSLPIAQQAALLCQDKAFKRFFIEQNLMPMPIDPTDEDMANAVRKLCGVKSRADIALNPEAAAKFMTLLTEFEVWKMVPA
jgi:hypothetical protein